jgi:hypothetical protein
LGGALTKPVVPRERVASDKGGQDIIRTGHATGTDQKKSEEDRKCKEALVFDIMHAPTKPHQLGARVPDHGTPNRSQKHYIANGIAEEKRHSFCCTAFRVGILTMASDLSNEI